MTRTCPHCKAMILASALVCPGCRGHLRYDNTGAPRPKTSWQVEGAFTAEVPGEPMEYCIVVSVRNERNEELSRQVVNVGTLLGEAKRTFILSVETAPGSK